MVIVIVLAYRGDAETGASGPFSAFRYDCAEHVFVLAVIVPEGKFVKVERQIVLDDVVVSPNDTALQERPKRLDIVGMHVAMNVLAFRVRNRFVLIALRAKVVAAMLVGCDQVNFVANRLTDGTAKARRGIIDYLAENVTLPADSADDGRFARHPHAVLPLIPMAILILAADGGFVFFDFTHELSPLAILHCRSNPSAHIPRGFVTAGSEHPMKLKRTHPLLRVAHEKHHLEPLAKWILRVLEDCLSDYGEAVAVPASASLGLTNPMKGAMSGVKNFFVAALRAFNAVGPPACYQIALAIFFVFEGCQQFIELQHATSLAA
jgi:hypothetical protein